MKNLIKSLAILLLCSTPLMAQEAAGIFTGVVDSLTKISYAHGIDDEVLIFKHGKDYGVGLVAETVSTNYLQAGIGLFDLRHDGQNQLYDTAVNLSGTFALPFGSRSFTVTMESGPALEISQSRMLLQSAALIDYHHRWSKNLQFNCGIGVFNSTEWPTDFCPIAHAGLSLSFW